MKPFSLPTAPPEIEALRARFRANPHDHAARVLFTMRCFDHLEAMGAAVEALVARSKDLSGSNGFGARREKVRILAELDAAPLWPKTVLTDVEECGESIASIPDAALIRLIRDLRAALTSAEFDAVDARFGLSAALDRATAELPDQSRMNALIFAAHDAPEDAKALFLSGDAIGTYSDDLQAIHGRMKAGEVPISVAWLTMAFDWMQSIAPEYDFLIAMGEAIDLPDQLRAAAKLSDDLNPEDVDRLRRRFGPIFAAR